MHQNLQKHLNALVQERNPFTTPGQVEKAANYIREHFNSLNYITKDEDVRYSGTRSKNILGFSGQGDISAGEFVLAAHYDTVEGSPGADDNASAVAALLEIARQMQGEELSTPLVFAAFTLEEYGFIGAKHFIQRAKEEGRHFKGMISLEMVGYRDREPRSQEYPPYVDASQYPDTGDFIAVVGNEPSAKLTHRVADGMDEASPKLKVERLVVPGRGTEFSEVNLSDHSPFWDEGIPAVMVTDTAFLRNPNYHQPTDTLDTLDLDFIAEVVEGVTGFLKRHLVKTDDA